MIAVRDCVVWKLLVLWDALWVMAFSSLSLSSFAVACLVAVLGLVVFVQALANDEMLVVGRFFSKSGSRCLFGGSQWLVVACCGFL